MTEKSLHRITLNLEDRHKDRLDFIKKKTGANTTDQIRKALDLYHYILDAQEQGKTLRSYEKDGSYREVVIIL